MRFRTLKNGYKFDKRIFQASILVLICLFSFIAYQVGFNSAYYYECSNPLGFGCDLSGFKQEFCNPLNSLEKFKAVGFEEWLVGSNLCNMEIAPQGFIYGEPPSKFMGLEVPATIIVILLTLFLNHIVWNRDYDFNLGGFTK